MNDGKLKFMEEGKTDTENVICLGKTFNNDEERREYFRNELRKRLPDLKQIEGYPIGEDEDIIALSDPPYYTACPNPWMNDFIEEWEKEKETIPGRKKDFSVDEPYASDVSEGKYDPMYLYHPYLTKVPHKAIMKFILHYTQPGDIILDGFAGTGMTGVAGRTCGSMDNLTRNSINQEFSRFNSRIPEWGERKTICNDLSPLAAFISYNYNSKLELGEFKTIVDPIFKNLKSECLWMFETKHKNGEKGIINYTLWSEVFLCQYCNGEIVFWDSAVNKEQGKVREHFKCPHCKSETCKQDLTSAKETYYDNILRTHIKQDKVVPVLINYTYKGKRYQKEPDKYDLNLINKIQETKLSVWFPDERMPKGDESRRNDKKGITHVHHFYSMKNFNTLAKLKSIINEPILNVLITKVAFQTTKLYRFTYQNGVWGAGGGPLSGTLYIPSLIKELNILNQIEDAIENRKRVSVMKTRDAVLNSVQSATKLTNINNNTIDYIFTDPPFGSNLMYSELNYLAESWLRIKTNNISEALENKSQSKSLLDYQNLMTKCFREYYRVLKPGKWMTVEFSNTSAAIWNSIQGSIQLAGFIIANISALDKQKDSFKAVTTPTAVKQDLIISCYKPSEKFEDRLEKQAVEISVWEFVKVHLEHLPINIRNAEKRTAVVERSPRILYDRLITFYMMRKLAIPIDATDFQVGLKQKFAERDGMFFTQEQATEYDEIYVNRKGEQYEIVFDSIYSESDAVLWLRERLQKKPQTYQDIMPDFRKTNRVNRKGELVAELKTVLEENFIQENNGKWRVPNMNEAKDREALRNKSLLKEFDKYKEELDNPKNRKIKEVRVEALRAGFKKCWEKKDFNTIVKLGDKIPQNILLEDEQLLMYYDIAKDRI